MRHIREPLCRGLATLLGSVCGIVLLFLMAVTVVDVVGRYFLNSPLLGAYELSEVSIGIIVAAALPLVTLHGSHVKLTLFDGLLGRHGLMLREIVSALLLALGTGFLAWRLWVETRLADRIGATTELLGIPMTPVLFFIAATFAVASLIAILTVAHGGRAKAGTRPDA